GTPRTELRMTPLSLPTGPACEPRLVIRSLTCWPLSAAPCDKSDVLRRGPNGSKMQESLPYPGYAGRGVDRAARRRRTLFHGGGARSSIQDSTSSARLAADARWP